MVAKYPKGVFERVRGILTGIVLLAALYSPSPLVKPSLTSGHCT